MSDTKPTVGVKGSSGSWVGVVRIGKRIVWECGHSHSNRDHSTFSSGRSARDCAASALMFAKKTPAEIEDYKRALLNNRVTRQQDMIIFDADCERAKTVAAAIQ